MQEMNVSLNEMYPIICEQLASGGKVRFKPNGTSMLPTLRQGIDEVELTKPYGKLKKYDIAFYRRKNGQFVLHRILGIKSDGSYIIRGDHQFQYEYGICDEDIIAVCCGIFRNGKYMSAKSLSFYLRAILGPFYFRTRFRLSKLRKKLRG